jgi:ABC-type glycerol-3-phosphate transport system permease component
MLPPAPSGNARPQPRLAAAVAMTAPAAILFFVFQRYIVRTGQGALKE